MEFRLVGGEPVTGADGCDVSVALMDGAGDVAVMAGVNKLHEIESTNKIMSGIIFGLFFMASQCDENELQPIIKPDQIGFNGKCGGIDKIQPCGWILLVSRMQIN